MPHRDKSKLKTTQLLSATYSTICDSFFFCIWIKLSQEDKSHQTMKRCLNTNIVRHMLNMHVTTRFACIKVFAWVFCPQKTVHKYFRFIDLVSKSSLYGVCGTVRGWKPRRTKSFADKIPALLSTRQNYRGGFVLANQTAGIWSARDFVLEPHGTESFNEKP